MKAMILFKHCLKRIWDKKNISTLEAKANTAFLDRNRCFFFFYLSCEQGRLFARGYGEYRDVWVQHSHGSHYKSVVSLIAPLAELWTSLSEAESEENERLRVNEITRHNGKTYLQYSLSLHVLVCCD